MDGLPDVELEIGVRARHALPRVHPDAGHELEFLVGGPLRLP